MPTPTPTQPSKAAEKPTQPASSRARHRSPWSLGQERSQAGSVWRYQTKQGRTIWRIRYRDASGRRILETLGPEPTWTQKRAQAELRRRLVAVDQDAYTKPQRLTLAAYAQQWLDTALPARNLKPSTAGNYRSILTRHLLASLGTTALADLEHHPDLVDRYIAQKLRSGLSPKTVTNHLLLLQVMLRQAVRWRLIKTNPITDAQRPRIHQPDTQILTPTQIQDLDQAYHALRAAASDPLDAEWWRIAHALSFTCLGTALRCGELLGLQWGDLDLPEARLHVRRAIVRGQLTTPKSRAGKRTIHLGPRTITLLEDHARQVRFTAAGDYVFAHPQLGAPLDPARLTRSRLRPALNAAGIATSFRALHDLRHTSLTHDAAAGNPAAYIQHRAGHSSAAITERYIHAAQTVFPHAPAKTEDRLFGR
jgi:integrase